jgi:tRNA-Thr(GGU) m(6)t(6)A37 methyltransferase TsaA
MSTARIDITPIGVVESPLTDRASAPKQGYEGAPDAWLIFDPAVLEGLEGIEPGERVIVLTWLDRADRDVLRVHPRDDPASPLQGVFNTRSSDRPNPIGMHEVEVLSIDAPPDAGPGSRGAGRNAAAGREAGAQTQLDRVRTIRRRLAARVASARA